MSKRSSPSIRQRLTPRGLVTGLALTLAIAMLLAQVHYARHREFQFGYLSSDVYFQLSLWDLNQRGKELAQLKDPIDRDERCIPISAFARRLDRSLAPDARVFVNGVLGRNRPTKHTVYYFLRNYLYPRQVELTLDGRVEQMFYGYEGISSDSPDELRANGFDVLIRMKTNNQDQVMYLTEKGLPK